MSSDVCVSVYGRDFASLRRNIRRALEIHPTYIELRLDYLRNPAKSVSDLTKLERDEEYIFTFRAKSEGGVARVSEEKRKKIILDLLTTIAPPTLDVEIKTLELFPEILDCARESGTRLIVSSHDFKRTESRAELEHLVVTSARKYSPAIVKIVRQANSFQDNLVVLSIYRVTERIMPARLIAFCSGQLGIFSRIVCMSCGSPFTFASLPGRKTAPGQLEAGSMISLLKSWRGKE